LAALAAAVLDADPFSGVVLVFRSRRADRVKILVWDGSGLVLVWKQLEGSTFRSPPVADGVLRLAPLEFAALFEGIDWRRVQKTKGIPRPSGACIESASRCEVPATTRRDCRSTPRRCARWCCNPGVSATMPWRRTSVWRRC
jgi:transposase